MKRPAGAGQDGAAGLQPRPGHGPMTLDGEAVAREGCRLNDAASDNRQVGAKAGMASTRPFVRP